MTGQMADIEIATLLDIARRAGAAIMHVYAGDHDVQYKDDNSPLTAADKASHEIIVAGLRAVTPEIPILSTGPRNSSNAMASLPSILPSSQRDIRFWAWSSCRHWTGYSGAWRMKRPGCRRRAVIPDRSMSGSPTLNGD